MLREATVSAYWLLIFFPYETHRNLSSKFIIGLCSLSLERDNICLHYSAAGRLSQNWILCFQNFNTVSGTPFLLLHILLGGIRATKAPSTAWHAVTAIWLSPSPPPVRPLPLLIPPLRWGLHGPFNTSGHWLGRGGETSIRAHTYQAMTQVFRLHFSRKYAQLATRGAFELDWQFGTWQLTWLLSCLICHGMMYMKGW